MVYEKRKSIKVKKKKVVETPEIRITPVIDTNDLNRKIDQARKFLKENIKVKIVMFFKTKRSVTVQNDHGNEILQKIIRDLQDSKEGIPESPVKNEGGRRYMVIICPFKMKKTTNAIDSE